MMDVITKKSPRHSSDMDWEPAGGSVHSINDDKKENTPYVKSEYNTGGRSSGTGKYFFNITHKFDNNKC
jgi:hypothetical protein